MALYRLVTSALAMATLSLAAAVNTANAHTRCATIDEAKAPFPGAVCHDITKPDGVDSAIFLSGRFNGSATSDAQDESSIFHSLAFHCDTERSTFSGKSANPDAPLSVDCEAVKTWVFRNHGNWQLTKEDLGKAEWTGLAAVDTCAFVLKTADAFAQLTLGNVDVRDLIILSLERHQIENKLEVLGRTECSAVAEAGDEVDIQVDWRIVKPGMVDVGCKKASE